MDISHKLNGFFRALVVDNVDPEFYGRITIWIPQLMPEIEQTRGTWCLPANNPAGGRNTDFDPENNYAGTCYVPKIGSWVWVFFETGNASNPYYFAACDIMHAQVVPECRLGGHPEDKWVIFKSHEGRTLVISDDPDDERHEITGKKRQIVEPPSSSTDSVYTVDGNQTVILLDERAGLEKVLIRTVKGDYIHVDIDEQNLQCYFANDIMIECGGSLNIKAVGDIQIKTDSNMYTTSVGNMHTVSNGDMLTKSDGNMHVKSMSAMKISSLSNMDILSKAKLLAASDVDMNIYSKAKMFLKSDAAMHIKTDDNMFHKAVNMHRLTDESIYDEASLLHSTKGGELIARDAPTILDNSGASVAAEEAVAAAPAALAESATPASPIPPEGDRVDGPAGQAQIVYDKLMEAAVTEVVAEIEAYLAREQEVFDEEAGAPPPDPKNPPEPKPKPPESPLVLDCGAGDTALGKTSERYESGGKGPGTVSTGAGDNGGVSYGTYQFASKGGANSSAGKFVQSSSHASEFSGLTPGSPEFSAKWKSVNDSDPNFGNEQHQYIKSNYYDPAMAKLQSQGVNPSSLCAGVREMVWSTAVQFGPQGAANIFKKAGVDGSTSNEDMIDKVYKEKSNVGSYFKSSSESVQKGVAKRYVTERIQNQDSCKGADCGSISPGLRTATKDDLSKVKSDTPIKTDPNDEGFKE